jgi:hypothetical protein|tara:strand:+ start:644 stop:832 length:189 start_codon:yes stop_codon:yes gene_type:complete
MTSEDYIPCTSEDHVAALQQLLSRMPSTSNQAVSIIEMVNNIRDIARLEGFVKGVNKLINLD